MLDLILKQGRVIDPNLGLDEISAIGFQNGRIAKVAPSLEEPAHEVRDVSGLIVTPGLIDLHTHVYWGGTSIGVDPDQVGHQVGCTTLVDAGTAGAANMLGFRRHVIDPAQTRVFAFINISFPGIFAFSKDVMVGECVDGRLLHAESCLLAAQEHSEVVVGVKVRVGRIAGGNNGIDPLEVALDVANELDLPLMAHLDHPPPGRREILERLRPGDILTHCFRPFPGAPIRSQSNIIYEDVLAARDRGIIFDIGHGMGSFGFQTARGMLANDFWPDVISSDVHSLCIDGPAFDLLETMSKLLCLGMPLIEVIRATTSNPAKSIGRTNLGSFGEGAIGDASILQCCEGEFEFKDVVGASFMGKQKLFGKAIVHDGEYRVIGE